MIDFGFIMVAGQGGSRPEQDEPFEDQATDSDEEYDLEFVDEDEDDDEETDDSFSEGEESPSRRRTGVSQSALDPLSLAAVLQRLTAIEAQLTDSRAQQQAAEERALKAEEQNARKVAVSRNILIELNAQT